MCYAAAVAKKISNKMYRRKKSVWRSILSVKCHKMMTGVWCQSSVYQVIVLCKQRDVYVWYYIITPLKFIIYILYTLVIVTRCVNLHGLCRSCSVTTVIVLRASRWIGISSPTYGEIYFILLSRFVNRNPKLAKHTLDRIYSTAICARLCWLLL